MLRAFLSIHIPSAESNKLERIEGLASYRISINFNKYQSPQSSRNYSQELVASTVIILLKLVAT